MGTLFNKGKDEMLKNYTLVFTIVLGLVNSVHSETTQFDINKHYDNTYAYDNSYSKDRYLHDDDTYPYSNGKYHFTNDDYWYGPGYYFGNWFTDEHIYWVWRRTHRFYPSNRNYYHPTRPIYYKTRSWRRSARRDRNEHSDFRTHHDHDPGLTNYQNS